VLGALSIDRTVIAIDLPGHGATPAALHWFEASGQFLMWDMPEETVAGILAAVRLER